MNLEFTKNPIIQQAILLCHQLLRNNTPYHTRSGTKVLSYSISWKYILRKYFNFLSAFPKKQYSQKKVLLTNERRVQIEKLRILSNITSCPHKTEGKHYGQTLSFTPKNARSAYSWFSYCSSYSPETRTVRWSAMGITIVLFIRFGPRPTQCIF